MCYNPLYSMTDPTRRNEYPAQALHPQEHMFVCAVPPMRRELFQKNGLKDLRYILPITSPLERALSLPPTISIPEGEFVRKQEFHVTLLGFSTRALLEEAALEAALEGRDLPEEINQILSEIDFSFTLSEEGMMLIHNLDYDPEAVRTRMGKAAFESESTVIVGMHMPGIVLFYERMRTLGIELGHPVAHVTLYIRQNGDATGLGIGITDLDGQLAGHVFPHITMKRTELS